MDVSRLRQYTDPDKCLRELKGIYPVPENVHAKQNIHFTTKDLQDIAREAIVHVKCRDLLGDLVPEPYGLQWLSDKNVAFISEEIRGETAFEYLVKNPKRVKYIVHRVMKAIQTMQNNGITHRDLHLANVMITQDEQVRIIDFGYAVIKDVDIQGAASGMQFPTTHSASQDACIFMRSIALVLTDPYHPYLYTYDCIMRRYERECEALLPHKEKPDYWDSVPTYINKRHRVALDLLYEKNNNWRDCRDLDYYLGAFEWRTMTPDALIRDYPINVS